MNIDPIIIGIAGGTGSGKSTLADNIKKEFAHNITMISHDCYIKLIQSFLLKKGQN